MSSDYKSKLLKKILKKDPLKSLLSRMADQLGCDVMVADSRGRTLWGEASEKHSSHLPVSLENTDTGMISSDSDVSSIRDLLNFALLKEHERKSLGKDLLEKYKEISVLYDIPEKLASSMRIHKIADVITSEVKRVINCDSVSLMLFKQGRFFINTGTGKLEKMPGHMDFLKTGGIARDIYRNGLGEIVNDVSLDQRYIRGDYKIGSLICVPVCIRENSYGVINVSRKEGAPFTSADLRLASAIAFQAASSIENSEFYEELEDKVKARTRELARANHVLNLEIGEHKKTKYKLEEEVRQAGEYIRKILPDPLTDPSMSVRWRFIPSALLGGDSFGYRWIDEDHFAVYLIDVCGHGVGAALLSVSIVNVLRSGSVSDKDMKDPAKVLSLLNSMFPASENHHNYFSIWYGVIHKGKKELICAGGGHPHPIAVTEDGMIQELQSQNPSVGILPDYSFKSGSFSLNRIRKVLIFSDGVFEIRDHSERTHNYQDFKQILDTCLQSDTLLEDLEGFSEQLNDSHKFDDDYTMIEIEFT